MVDLLLNKDIFPSIENVCPHRYGVDICNGRESYSETQQHGELQQPSKDSRSQNVLQQQVSLMTLIYFILSQNYLTS